LNVEIAQHLLGSVTPAGGLDGVAV
jgi:hypothetical protein